MRKRILSLCMVLFLCLGLLPATAQAATAHDILWIGNTRITDSGYWITDGNGNLTASDAGNYNVAFDADTNTLTLNNANIAGQYDLNYNGSAAGIWAYSRSGAVSLNIQVTGNNVVSGSIGIYALSNGGEVSVTISGGGSLTASGSQNGISIVSEFSNAALAIEGTAVKASGSYSEGVWVQAGESSTGSLSVDGGSLTASGNTGIEFLFSTGMSGSGTPSLTVAGNAVVDAKSGGIAHNSSNNLSIQGNSGMVFNGSTGTVYGNASLQKDLIIGEGESLTLDHGASLDANGHNVIVDGGTLDEGIKNSLDDSVKYTPTITTTSLPNGTAEAAYSTTLLADGTAPITWSVTSGSLPEGLSLDASTGAITGTPTAAGTSTFTVKAESSYGSDSMELSITINEPATISVTGVSLDKDSLNLYVGGNETLTATVQPANATNKGVTWSSSAESVATVDANGKVTAVSAGNATITATAADGSGKSATCTVTVTENKPSTGGGTVISKPTTSRISGDDRFETAVEVADQLKKELGVTKFNSIVVAYSDDFADALSASAFAHENEAPVLVVNENNEEYVKKYIEQNLVKDGKVYIMGGNTVVTERFEDSLSEFNVSRLGGSDRYETNLLTLKQLNLGGKDTIIIASGLDYADALSASSTGLPVMIVGDKLTASQIAYLKTLGGNDTYYIAGGTAAVSSEVEKQLKDFNLGAINRLAGDDRYETSVLIAETFYEKSTLAYLASGDDFPDGLTGGVLAGLSRDGKGAPLLLVNEHNTNLAASYIEDAGVRTVKAIGGTAAISDETLKAVI